MIKYSPQILTSEERANTPTPTPTTHTPYCTDYLLNVQAACFTSCLLYILPTVHLIYCTYCRAKSSARIAYCTDCLLYRFSTVEVAYCSDHLLISVRLSVVLIAYCQLVGWLVSWCFKPSQSKKIISGLRETFIQRYIVERTSKAEKDWKNRVRKRRVVGRIYGMKYS